MTQQLPPLRLCAILAAEWCIEYRHWLRRGILALGSLLLWRQHQLPGALLCLAALLVLLFPMVRLLLVWAVVAYSAYAIAWQSDVLLAMSLGSVLAVGWLVVEACDQAAESPVPVVARWGQFSDLVQAQQLAQPGGVVLGRYKGHLVTYDQPGHVLVIGPTRSGKSSSILVPTLLHDDTPQSYLVHDPKLELHSLTAGHRASLGRIIQFAPTLGHSHRYNPLSAVPWNTPEEYRQVDLLAEQLCTPDGDIVDEAGRHFSDLARVLLRGIIVYGHASGRVTTLGQLQTLLASVPVATLLDDMGVGTHPLPLETVAMMGDLANKERSGVVSTCRRVLSLYADPHIARSVSANDFMLADLRGSPLSLYCGVPFSDQVRCRGILRLCIRQWLDHSMSDLTAQGLPLTFIGEEFPSLRRLGILEDSLLAAAGYGVRMILATPGLHPLYAHYGEHMPFLENCAVRCAFPNPDPEMAGLLASGSGMTRRFRHSWAQGTSWNGGVFGSTSASTTTNYQEEELLSSTSFMRLEKGHLLCAISQQPPLILETASYWQDEEWLKRSRLPAPSG